ncbi:MAG: glycerate kinase [Phycisphaerae bacterium]|nr:glycerate kinase [Phycisphaerae bacterium]
MKVVIAPDSFKESLPAAEVAKAIAEGVLGVCPDAQIDLCPMADGGEGTVEAMVAATGGRYVTADVFDPLGGEVRARFGLLGHDETAMLPGEVGLTAAEAATDGQGSSSGVAVVEMAAASGLGLVPPGWRNPLHTNTYGTGQLLLAAIDAGAEEIILGVGGSATVDGGCGMAQALGVDFYAANGELCMCGLPGGRLADIARIDTRGVDPRIAAVRIRVACDVTNPLTGPEGAAAIFGPQKGATPEMVEKLEAGLVHLAKLVREQLEIELELPGAGAAGGLGGGLVAFAGATLENGGKMIAEAIDLPKRLAGADLCITGEGKMDGQSRYGKVPVRVASLAGAAGVSTICIPGIATDDAPTELFREVLPLVADGVSPARSMAEPVPILHARAEAAMRTFMAGGGR